LHLEVLLIYLNSYRNLLKSLGRDHCVNSQSLFPSIMRIALQTI